MAYGILKCDQITFTNGGIDQTVTVSGIVQSISGNITATGTIQGATIIGTSTVSGATVTGDAGVFTTVTGDSAGFTTVTGTTVTGTTANFATISGTTITGGALTVASGTFSGNSTAAAFIPTGSTTPTNGLYLPATNTVALSTSGTQRVQFGTSEVVFNDGGNNYDFRIEGDTVSNLFFVDASADAVGIGTSAPSTALHTFSTGSEWLGQFGNITANGSNLRIRYNAIGAFAANSVASNLLLNPDGGSVGIGTTSPARSLHVSANAANTWGYIRIAGQGRGAQLEFATDSTVTAGIYSPTSTDSLVFFTSSSETERARIDSSGRLLVGTVPSPAYQLQLETDSAGKPSTNTWTIVSDERIKEEIELADLDLCYEAVKNIPLKRFKWKDEVYTEEQAYDRRKLGWIAQDVEAVFPKAVRQHEFRYNQVFEEVVIPAVPAELDDDGNIITEEQPERIEKGELISEEVIEDCRDLNSDQLYAAMYGAIQKLISKVESLEAEVQALKAA